MRLVGDYKSKARAHVQPKILHCRNDHIGFGNCINAPMEGKVYPQITGHIDAVGGLLHLVAQMADVFKVVIVE
ncbi:hypothetical protein D3C84_1000340 [compost metagenome]